MLLLRRLPAFIAAAMVMPAFAMSPESSPHSHEAGMGDIGELPLDFVDHFYNVPLAAKVVADGVFLGDAMLVISKNDTVQLLHFTDLADSKANPLARERIADALSATIALHRAATDNPHPFIRQIQFDIATSTLDIVTHNDERLKKVSTYHAPPLASSGLIVNQRLNIAASGADKRSGRYWIDAMGSAAGWTTSVNAQYARRAIRHGKAEITLQQAFAQKELKGHFVRVGRFQPDTIGLYRVPRGANSATAIAGVMLGSSDSLRVETGTDSTQPLYVTASRPAVVELFRQGVLLHSQPINAGLQPIDTKRLPAGIYPVELHVIEDGVLRSSDTQVVYKPGIWTDTTRRFRYNLFTGRTTSLGATSSWDRGAQATTIGGGGVNLLLHPRAILGVSAVTTTNTRALAASVDVDAGNWASLYANTQYTARRGRLADVQWVARLPKASLSVGLSNAQTYRRRELPRMASERCWNATGNWRLGYGSQVVGRISRGTRRQKKTYDVSVDRTIRLEGGQVLVRASFFDRARQVKLGNERDRGMELTATVSFNQARHSWSANMGQRAGERSGRDTYGSAQYLRQSDGAVSQLSSNINADRYGMGASTAAYMTFPLVRVDAYLQRSTLGSGMQFGLNADNTFAWGAGHISSSGLSSARFGDALIAVDLVTDAPDVPVHASDDQGGTTLLKPGRNVLPLRAYAPGRINFDVHAYGETSATLDRRNADYHANRGSVAYATLNVQRTQTFLGRLLDANRLPIGGALIEQDRHRSMSEATGVFLIEAKATGGSLTISRQENRLCQIDLPRTKQETEVTHLGDIVCAE